MSFFKPKPAPALPSAPATPAAPPVFGQQPQGSPSGSGQGWMGKSASAYAATILGGTSQPAFTSNNKTFLGQ